MKSGIIKNIFTSGGLLARHRNLILIIIKIIITAGLLFYVINYIDPQKIFEAMKAANMLIIAFTLLLLVINIYLQYMKWGLCCHSILEVKSRRQIFLSLFYGFSAGAFTPARIGEYFGRAIAIKDRTLLQVTVATVVDKLFPLLNVTFFGAVGSIVFLYYYYNVTLYVVLSLFILLFTLYYLLILLLISPDFWDNYLFNKIKSSPRVGNFLRKFIVIKHLDKKFLVKMFLYSFLFYLCYIIQFALLVSAFSHNPNIVGYLWGGSLMIFAKTLIPPVSIGELGIREGAAVFFLTYIGETSSAAFNASIFLFIMNVLVPSVIGLIFFFLRNDD